MEEQIRNAARRLLPPKLRRPLGWMAGAIQQTILRPIEGWIFDLMGGRFRADGCTFTVPKDVTSRSYRSCFLWNTYEREERELVRKLIQPGDRVLELGACLGVVSCVTNRLLADPSAHVVVEGNPFCIATIQRNRKLNGAGFLIEHCAVSTQSEVTFYLHPVYIVGGTAQRITNRPVRVPGKSLRQLEREHGPFNALIMDIEGSELEVFEASADLLSSFRIIIVELHSWAIGESGVERCREILRECGLHPTAQAGITEAWQRT